MSYPTEKLKDVFTILKQEGKKDRWLRVGVGFINRDNSISVKLDAIPTNGTLHIRDYMPRIGRMPPTIQAGAEATEQTELRPSALEAQFGLAAQGGLP